MSWVACSLATVVLWAFWGLLGKVALKTVGWAQASLFFGVATLAIYGVILAVRPREATWSPTDLLVPLATGFVGALGLAFFYLALERGKASVVVPMVGLYPVLTAVLSVLLLHERLAPLQIAGVALAAAAVVLIGIGGRAAASAALRCRGYAGPPEPRPVIRGQCRSGGGGEVGRRPGCSPPASAPQRFAGRAAELNPWILRAAALLALVRRVPTAVVYAMAGWPGCDWSRSFSSTSPASCS